MENVNLYLLILLVGVIIGGLLVVALIANLMRPPAWGPPPHYVASPAAPPASGTGLVWLLLLLGALTLWIVQSQHQQHYLPVTRETPTERHYHPGHDGLYDEEWGN